MTKPIARLIALLAVCAVCAGAFSACEPSEMRPDEMYRISRARDRSPIVTFNPDYEYGRTSEPNAEAIDDVPGSPVEFDFKEKLEFIMRLSQVTAGVPDSLYLAVITKRLSREEIERRYAHLDAYNDPFVNRYYYKSFYEAVIIYDYLRDEPVNKPIVYTYYSSELRALTGIPPLIEGDRFISVLTYPVFGENVVFSLASMLHIYDDVVTRDSYGYSCRNVARVITDIGERPPDDMRYYYAPDEKNPRIHNGRAKIGAVVDQYINGIKEGGYDFPKD